MSNNQLENGAMRMQQEASIADFYIADFLHHVYELLKINLKQKAAQSIHDRLLRTDI